MVESCETVDPQDLQQIHEKVLEGLHYYQMSMGEVSLLYIDAILSIVQICESYGASVSDYIEHLRKLGWAVAAASPDELVEEISGHLDEEWGESLRSTILNGRRGCEDSMVYLMAVCLIKKIPFEKLVQIAGLDPDPEDALIETEVWER